MNKLLIFSTLASLIFTSCEKEGIGGEGKFFGNIMHHNIPIPNATIYIKYGAEEFPGDDISIYDDSQEADSTGYYSFDNLNKGDYYLYSRGYDATILDSVSGGIRARIVKKGAEVEVSVPTTEGSH